MLACLEVSFSIYRHFSVSPLLEKKKGVTRKLRMFCVVPLKPAFSLTFGVFGSSFTKSEIHLISDFVYVVAGKFSPIYEAAKASQQSECLQNGNASFAFAAAALGLVVARDRR